MYKARLLRLTFLKFTNIFKEFPTPHFLTDLLLTYRFIDLLIVDYLLFQSEPLRNHLTIYLVIYSIDDRSAFEWAAQTLYRLSENKDYHQRHLFAILVANKVDLVRSRAVKPLGKYSILK